MQPIAFEFWNDHGICKDLLTGTTETFRFSCPEDGTLELVYDDRTETYRYAIEIAGSLADGDPLYRTMTMMRDGEPDICITHVSSQNLEGYPIYSRPEIIDAVSTYFEHQNGKAPTKIEYDSEGLLHVYDGETELGAYTPTVIGTMWEINTDECVYYQAAPGDVNLDLVVDASDAAAILVEAAVLGSGSDSTFNYLQNSSGDIDGNGKINASDAACLLIYAASVGAGDTSVLLTDFRVQPEA